MYADDLLSIAKNAPSSAASSAVVTLKLLASHGDLAAILALSRFVASELGLPDQTPGLLHSKSVAELLADAATAPIIRVYALGFIPRESLARIETAAELALVETGEESLLQRFQLLVLRQSLAQHEALRAYVLRGFAQSVSLSKTLGGLDLAASGGALRVLASVLGSRVVDGHNSDTTFAFGRELIAKATTAGWRFSISHELGHYIPSQLSPPRIVGSEPLKDVVNSLPEVLAAAVHLADHPLERSDPRALSAHGVWLLCTYEELPAGAYIHMSLRHAGDEPIDFGPARAACLVHPLSHGCTARPSCRDLRPGRCISLRLRGQGAGCRCSPAEGRSSRPGSHGAGVRNDELRVA